MVWLDGRRGSSAIKGEWTLPDFACTLHSVTTERDPMIAVRAELKARREALGLTHIQAGRRVGITGQWWGNLEKGYQEKSGVRLPVKIARRRLISMARAVEWSPDEALRLAGMAPLNDEERLTGEPRQELARLVATLSDARVAALLHVVRTMRDPNAGPDPATKAVEGEIPPPRDALEPIDEDEGNGISLD